MKSETMKTILCAVIAISAVAIFMFRFIFAKQASEYPPLANISEVYIRQLTSGDAAGLLALMSNTEKAESGVDTAKLQDYLNIVLSPVLTNANVVSHTVSKDSTGVQEVHEYSLKLRDGRILAIPVFVARSNEGDKIAWMGYGLVSLGARCGDRTWPGEPRRQIERTGEFFRDLGASRFAKSLLINTKNGTETMDEEQFFKYTHRFGSPSSK